MATPGSNQQEVGSKCTTTTLNINAKIVSNKKIVSKRCSDLHDSMMIEERSSTPKHLLANANSGFKPNTSQHQLMKRNNQDIK